MLNPNKKQVEKEREEKSTQKCPEIGFPGKHLTGIHSQNCNPMSRDKSLNSLIDYRFS
jgi:hypothetical protein